MMWKCESSHRYATPTEADVKPQKKKRQSMDAGFLVISLPIPYASTHACSHDFFCTRHEVQSKKKKKEKRKPHWIKYEYIRTNCKSHPQFLSFLGIIWQDILILEHIYISIKQHQFDVTFWHHFPPYILQAIRPNDPLHTKAIYNSLLSLKLHPKITPFEVPYTGACQTLSG